MDILAQLEVKVINKEGNLKAELEEIEQNEWKKMKDCLLHLDQE